MKNHTSVVFLVRQQVYQFLNKSKAGKLWKRVYSTDYTSYLFQIRKTLVKAIRTGRKFINNLAEGAEQTLTLLTTKNLEH